MFRLIFIAFVSMCFALPMDVSASAVWFSTSENLLRVDSTTNAIALTLPVKGIRSLATDSRGAVWVVTAKQASKFAADGTIVYQADLGVIGLIGGAMIAVDPHDDSVWLSDQKTTIRLDTNGRSLVSFSGIDAATRQILVAQDQSIWVLGNKQLTHYSPQGALIARVDLHAVATAEPQYFAVDDVGGHLWFAGEKELIQVDHLVPQHTLQRITLGETALGVSLDLRSGAIWVLGNDTLAIYDKSGTQLRTVDLKGKGITGADTLALDLIGDDAWLTQKTGLVRFSASSGSLLARIATQKSAEEVGIAPLRVLPQLDLIHPDPQFLTNNPRPNIALQYGVACNGQPCGFSNTFFGSYVLNATINSQSVGNLFVFDLASGRASFVPSARLPEGTNMFSAQVQDRFGHFSNIIGSTFTVDTVAPTFLSLTPASPLITNQALLQIAGRLSEPSKLRIGAGEVAVGADGSFGAVRTLAEGVNSVALAAQDLAGNQTSKSLEVTLDTIAPVFVDLRPNDGTITNLSSIVISGSLSETATLLLGADSLTLGSDNSFATVKPLILGVNVFVFKATDRAGNVASRTISITRASLAPKLQTVSPANGAVVSAAPARITGTFDDARSVTLVGADVTQSVDGRVFAFDVTLQPGANTFKLRAVNAAGNVTQETISLTFATYDARDAPYMTVWYGMNGALAAGDVARALTYLTTGAQEKYKPIFEALIADMPAIVGSYSTPSRGSVSEDMAEFAIMRNFGDAEGTKVFFIYFVKTDAGSWLVESM